MGPRKLDKKTTTFWDEVTIVEVFTRRGVWHSYKVIFSKFVILFSNEDHQGAQWGAIAKPPAKLPRRRVVKLYPQM